jgi:ATP-binding cassette subfamily C protein LapB
MAKDMKEPVPITDSRPAPPAAGADAVTGASWLWGTLARYWREYVNVAVGAILINVFTLASPLFVANVYDRVVPNRAFETLWVLAVGVGIVFFFDFLLRSLRAYLVDVAGRGVDVRVSSGLFHQVLGARFAHRPASAGEFASNLRDFEMLRDFLTSATLLTVIDLPFALFFIAMVGLISPPLALIPLAAVPLVVGVALVMQVPLTRLVEENFRVNAHKQGILVESIYGLEAVKSQRAEDVMQGKWEYAVRHSAESGLKSRLLSGLALHFTNFAQQIVTVAVVVGGVYLIAANQLTLGGLIACSILSGRALAALTQAAALMTRYQNTRTALKSLDRIMALPQERPAGRAFLQRPPLNGEVEFSRVVFAYPGQQTPALEGVAFRVRAGERVAILGRVGSGKSTVLKLALGLYQPTSGAVLMDGTDIAQLDPGEMRAQLGYVPQEVLLFSGTMRENITLGRPQATDAEVLEAARLAGVDEFVRRHPLGYDLRIGESGTGLSGGQRQAVATARALLGAPRVLLLDEPTSSMDNSSEQAYLGALRSILEGRTLLLVTHKPSMLALVDRLIVIEGRRVVADGPKDKVLAALERGMVRQVAS